MSLFCHEIHQSKWKRDLQAKARLICSEKKQPVSSMGPIGVGLSASVCSDINSEIRARFSHENPYW